MTHLRQTNQPTSPTILVMIHPKTSHLNPLIPIQKDPQKISQSSPANNFLRLLQDWPTPFVMVES